MHFQFLSPPLIKERRILDGVETANYYHGLGKRSIFAKKKRTTTTTTTTTEEKYKVLFPESMQETFMSDSEDEGGENYFFTQRGPVYKCEALKS